MPQPTQRRTVGQRVLHKAGIDRSRYSQELLERTREAWEKKDSSGKFNSYIKDEYLTKQWACTEGEHILDVIPYIAGPNHPSLKEGTVALLLDLFVHRGVGANEDSYVCLSRTFNQPCPICEDQREKRKSGEFSDADLKALNPSRRSVYNAWIHDNEKEEDKGVQIFEVAQWFFDKHISERSKISRTGEHINYGDPDTGKSIQFKRKGKGAKNTEYLAHTFIDRDYAIPDEILEQALTLDQIITVPTYEEVYKAHFGEDMPEGEHSNKQEERLQPPPVLPTTRASRSTRIPTTKTEEECPGEGQFGVDTDNLPQCGECAVWDSCNAIFIQQKPTETKAPLPTTKTPFKSRLNRQ